MVLPLRRKGCGLQLNLDQLASTSIIMPAYRLFVPIGKMLNERKKSLWISGRSCYIPYKVNFKLILCTYSDGHVTYTTHASVFSAGKDPEGPFLHYNCITWLMKRLIWSGTVCYFKKLSFSISSEGIQATQDFCLQQWQPSHAVNWADVEFVSWAKAVMHIYVFIMDPSQVA